MTRIVKNVVEIQNEFPGYHTLIVYVNAGGLDFIECYVGVNIDSNFWSKYDSITFRDKRFQLIEKLGFELYGSRKEFERGKNISELMPLDGAWLSFARKGTCYDFLNNELFYYGAGFNIDSMHKNKNEVNSRDAAEIQITRILKVLVNENNNIGKPAEADESDIWEFLEKSDYFNKTIYSWISFNYAIGSIKICRELTKLSLYDFSQKLNQKIWQLHGTGIFIRADGKIYEDIKYDKDFPKNHFWSLEDAITARVAKEKLHPSDIEKLEALLGDFLNKRYWRNIVDKAKEQKLNRNERANLKALLLLLKNGLLDETYAGTKIETDVNGGSYGRC